MTKDDLVSKDTALKMAIEVMDNIEIPFRQYADEAINACKEALEPEPMTTTDVITCKMAGKCCMTGEALEQPAWQGLTDDEDNAIIKKIWIWGNDFPYEKYRIAIEQALKDKNICYLK